MPREGAVRVSKCVGDRGNQNCMRITKQETKGIKPTLDIQMGKQSNKGIMF